MRSILIFALFSFGLVVSAHAQIFQVEVDGVITGAGGIYSNLPSGTPYSFEMTFNAANATLLSSTSSSATYADPTATSSFSFAGFNYSGTAPQIQITSGEDLGDGEAIYGFEFTQNLASGAYAVQLLSLTASVAPTTALSSLHAENFAEYQNSLNLGGYFGGDVASGRNTSFSVQVQTAPEPASISLAVLALLAFAWLRQRQAWGNA